MSSPTLAGLKNKRVTVNEMMNPEDFIAFMNRHGLSVRELAQILGVGEQAVNLWRKGDREISVLNSRLFRIFDKFPGLLKEF